MKLYIGPILIGLLALAGVSPATAQSKPASDPGTSVGMSTARDAAAERSNFTQQARDEVRDWQQKLHDFDAKAKVKATATQANASKVLNDAWTETKSASSELETATEADWASAKASFKTASNKLAVAWHKVNPTEK
jgi:hypothetical protein